MTPAKAGVIRRWPAPIWWNAPGMAALAEGIRGFSALHRGGDGRQAAPKTIRTCLSTLSLRAPVEVSVEKGVSSCPRPSRKSAVPSGGPLLPLGTVRGAVY
jgi:hypothetical protein